MEEPKYRNWNIFFKWFGLGAALAGAYWTVHTYSADKARELKQDEEARTKELNAFVFQHQATLYFDAARAAATIATAIDPAAQDGKLIDTKSLNDARVRFAQLYWGEMAAVEDRRVELAMIAFQNCLLGKRKKCLRFDRDQYDKPIDKDATVPKGTERTLQELALEIGVCTRTALQEGRKIEFGEMKPAITGCPYDGKKPTRPPSPETASHGL